MKHPHQASCQSYPGEGPGGAPWELGKVMGVIAGFGGLLVFFCGVLLGRIGRRVLGALYIVLGVASLIMLAGGMNPDMPGGGSWDSPTPSAGAYLAIVSGLSYFGAALSTYRMVYVPVGQQVTIAVDWPHAKIVLVPICLGCIACVLSMTAATHCDFLRVDNGYYETLLGYITRGRFDEREGCMPWPEYLRKSRDTAWKTGMVAGIIAGYGGVLVVGTNSTMICLNISDRTQKVLAGLYLTLASLSLLMLLGFASEFCQREGDTCHMSTGSVLAIAASAIYCFAGVFLLVWKYLEAIASAGTEMNAQIYGNEGKSCGDIPHVDAASTTVDQNIPMKATKDQDDIETSPR